MKSRRNNRIFVLSLASVATVVLAFLFVPLACEAQQPKDQASAGSHDFSGVWKMPPEAYGHYDQSFGTTDLPMTPWAKKKFDDARPSEGPKGVTIKELNDPFYACYPPGVPRIYLHPFAMEIVQTPKEVVQLFEYDHLVRHIYIDGRPHPDDPDPTWMGNSIGHWEGDTLVVDGIGFNDKSWIDRVGHPHSEKLHVIERWRRVSPTTAQVDFTLEDPVAYTKPIKKQFVFLLQPKWEILEHVCIDNAEFLEFNKKETQHAK
jgi:hypothetical protein